MLLLQASAISPLSIRARTAIALVCLEQYVEKQAIVWPSLTEFIEFMWELPCASDFAAWDKVSPLLLRSVGLGDPIERDFPEDARNLLNQGVLVEQLSELIQNTTEIVYSSAYGATDNEGSMRFLLRVIDICIGAGAHIPSTDIFSSSAFSENNGWATPVPPAQRDYWRGSARIAP